jgi:hypothetical protein
MSPVVIKVINEMKADLTCKKCSSFIDKGTVVFEDGAGHLFCEKCFDKIKNLRVSPTTIRNFLEGKENDYFVSIF